VCANQWSHHDQQDVSAIEQRRLGASGIEVRAVGIGTQQWGDKRWGYGKSYTRDDHEATYQTLLDAGVNLLDTSENYGGGLAEQFIGEFHRADGRPIFLATKFTPAKIYDPSTRMSAKSMMSTLDGSLKRLGVDAVDLYQLHYPPARRRLGSYLDGLAETVKVGKARAVGVSNFNVELLRYAHEYRARRGIALASNQTECSLLCRHPEGNGMLAACEELDIALIAILPLGEGVLSGKYRVGGEPYPSRVRNILTVTNLDLFHQEENAESIVRRIRRKPYELQREALEPLFDLEPPRDGDVPVGDAVDRMETFSRKKSIELASPAAARRRAVDDAGRRRKPPTATDRAGPRAPTASDPLLSFQRQPSSTV
jgi:aryl-alcohol dehydrogenase-like predicted oxidoreductase